MGDKVAQVGEVKTDIAPVLRGTISNDGPGKLYIEQKDKMELIDPTTLGFKTAIIPALMALAKQKGVLGIYKNFTSTKTRQ